MIQHHHHIREVSYYRVLVLQIVEETEAFGGEVLADYGHPEVCTASGGVGAAAVLCGECSSVEAGGVGEGAGFGQEGFPRGMWEAAGVPVGAGVFAAVVEEAVVIVFVLEGEDLGGDEGVEGGEEGFEGGGDGEVHCFGGHGGGGCGNWDR